MSRGRNDGQSNGSAVEAMITPILAAIGIELVEVEYRKEQCEQMLAYLYRSGGRVDLAPAPATRAVQDTIDEANIAYDHLKCLPRFEPFTE